MTHKAKDLSPDQRRPSKACWGARLALHDEITIRVTTPPSAPEWLQESCESRARQGLDQLSMEEIDEEIAAAARKARR